MNTRWSLRTWMAAIVVAVALSPLLTGVATVLAVKLPSESQTAPWQRQSLDAQRQALALIQSRRDEWASPTFQRELTESLVRGRWSVALLDSQGRVVFNSGRVSHQEDDTLRSFSAPSQVGWIRGPSGAVAGTYFLARSGVDPTTVWFGLAAVAGLSLAATLAVWSAGRAISGPVHGLAEAAHMINSGELDFALPASQVKELNELSAAFGAMRDGLRTSIVEQAAMEQERRMFIAAIAHDLRTPLSSVRGYLEGLRDGIAHTPEKTERYIAVALDKTASLESLIDGLFAYAKTEYLSQPPQREPVDLGELLRGAVAAMRPRADASGVSLMYAEGTQSCRLMGDSLMLTRIVDNLLDNALRYTPRGGRVAVGWSESAEVCQFWVHDSGPGIPEDDRGQVFQPLYRGDKARGTRTGGAGLGLAIARRLAQAHGGDITVVGDGGARFTVTLPSGGAQEG